uniref:Glycosyltransferase 8 domain containing 2 n=1 Tax=Salmo trutta TaxID=8032 RepID=A0A674F208_SALTR
SLCCVTVNHILLMMLVLIVCLLLHSKLFRGPSRPKLKRTERASKGLVEKAAEGEDDIPVVICAAEERMGGAMATINSIYSNTDASVFFYIVTLRDSIKLTRPSCKILEFNPMVLKGKVKPDSSRPDLLHPVSTHIHSHRKVIYLDDDVIVQGDIKDLYHTKLEKGHAAAFMVRSMGMQTTYMGFLNYRKQEVRDLGINPSDCSFNPGVFVADIGEWKKQKITKQLEKWLQENLKENIYSSAMAGGVSTPPMLIVFHDEYTIINPLWHVRHLGWSPDARYSETFLQGAHLLHWNGRFKLWDYPCVHLDRWEKWFIPDPTGKFLLVRPEGKI